MESITRERLDGLLAVRGGVCVTFYLATGGAGPEPRQGPIRLKNLLRDAEAALRQWIPREAEAARLLAPAQALVEAQAFWRDPAPGLALFVVETGLAALRLPAAPADLAVVADRFYVKPLLPLVGEEGAFALLALSQHRARLLRVTRDGWTPLPMPGAPGSLADTQRFDDRQGQTIYHPTASRSTGAPGQFYGHGTALEEGKDDLRRYARQVDQALVRALRGEALPLLLAAAEPLASIYRELTAYPDLAPAVLAGNPDEQDEAELQRRGWAAMQPHFSLEQARAAATFERLAGTGRASADLGDVLRAARDGRVDRLFVTREGDRWGRFDAETGQATVHEAPEPGDEALVDRCAAETLRHHGTVYAVPGEAFPKAAGGSPVAALYRY